MRLDEEKVRNAVRLLLEGLGIENEEVLSNTPDRVVRFYKDFMNNTNNISMFDETVDAVEFTNIRFYSLCEHHILPFFGHVNIRYKPNGQVIGLSKVVRIVDMCSRKLTLQERMTKEIATKLHEYLRCEVEVEVIAQHMCMMMRGVKNKASVKTYYKISK